MYEKCTGELVLIIRFCGKVSIVFRNLFLIVNVFMLAY